MLAHEARILLRWDTERDIVSFAVVLQHHARTGWSNVALFDCSHPGKNDFHRYSQDGRKLAAEIFHRGTAAEAFRTAIELIRSDYERMIEQWQR